MDNVTVNKDELLAILKTNRDQHQTIFQQALTGYKAEAVRQLKRHLAEVESGRVKAVNVMLPVPENHTKDYDRAIRMVEMSVDTQLEIDEASFGQYVMDDWRWKRQFLTSSSAYSTAAAQMLNDEG